MDAAPPLPPPAIEQPAPHQVSYGLVTGRAAPGTRRVVVSANGRVLVSKPLRGRRFALRVELPAGDVTRPRDESRRDGRRLVTRRPERVRAARRGAPSRRARPRRSPPRADAPTADAARYGGTSAFYVQSLTSGSGAAWNARARFPAASTLKLAIAAAVLAEHDGDPGATARTSAASCGR